MLAILRKELNTFFNTPIGYLIIGLFLTIIGLFLWVFDGVYNIPNSGFADLKPFFELTPWIFIILIPAMTMRSLSEEKKQGTLELLLTKPLSTLQLVLGKYIGVLIIIIIALIPTLINVAAIHQLGNPLGNLDIGVTIGSYIGLLLLGAVFSAIGIFASSLTANQIVAFLIGISFCFLFYFGLDNLGNYRPEAIWSSTLNYLSLKTHYDSISRGVIDTRDVLFFISVIAGFVYASKINLEKYR